MIRKKKNQEGVQKPKENFPYQIQILNSKRMAPSTGERKLEISSTNKSRLTPDLTRLPTSVIPKRYELKLDVEPELKSYTGQVYIRIFIEGDVSSNTIWLHSKNLDIWSASIQFSQFALPFEASEILEVQKQ